MRAPRDVSTLALQLGSFVLVLGIPDGALGVLWPSMRRTFGLPLDDLGILVIAGTALYFLGGLLGDKVRLWLRLGNTLLVACVVAVVAIAAWGLAPDWGVLLAGVALLGLSRGAIDAVVNAEAALDGGPRRLGVVHGSWGIGGTLGPVLVTAFVVLTGNWRPAVLVTAAAITVFLVPLAVKDRRRAGALELLPVAEQLTIEHAADVVPPPAATRRVAITLTVVAFAVYTAAEAGPVSWGYTYLTDGRKLSHALATVGVACFWAALTAGRFGLVWIGHRVSGVALLDASCGLLVAGTAMTWLLHGVGDVFGLLVAGLGSAAVFPMLIALTPHRVGASATGRAVGAAIAGAAVGGPAAVALFGVVAAHLGTTSLAPCFVIAAAAMVVANRALTLASRQGAASLGVAQ